MKRETVNIFQEGLNMDLNPLVTPNNVLSDALNATTITFNGDELSLQTDAGNTKIKVKGKDEYVKLSDGFYPLGIKEYGGVLYIVSGRSVEINKKKLKENTDYFLYDVIRFKDNFYYCNTNTHIEEIPEILSSDWTLLSSNLEEAEKLFNKVEFGSYPSPEFASDKTLPGSGALLTTTNLYTSITINNNDFKTGRRIEFISHQDTDLTNVARLNVNEIYHVKLLHKLESGVLDLTEDIWNKFEEHKNKTGDSAIHWLVSETFNYYCPTQYKGKLQLQVILDEPEYFNLVSSPTYIEKNEIELEDVKKIINPELENYSGILKFEIDWLNSEHIKLSTYKLTISFSDSRDDLIIDNITKNEISVKIPYKNNNLEAYTSIDYNIIPVWQHEGGLIDENEVPSEFINKYKITGIKLLEGRFNEVYFDLSDSRCSGNGYMVYSKAILRNRDSMLDENLNPTDEELVFLLKGTDSTNLKVLALYELDGNKPKIIVNPALNSPDQNLVDALNKVQEGLYDHLKDQFKATDVQLTSTTCSQFTLYFKFNLAFALDSPFQVSEGYRLSFTQPSVSREGITYVSTDSGRTFRIEVDTIEDIVINFTYISSEDRRTDLPHSGRMQGIVLKKENLKDGNTYNIGIVTPLKSRDIVRYVYDSGGASGRTPDKVSEFNYNTLDVQNSLLGEYIKVNNLFTIDPPSGKTMDIMYNTNYQTLYIKMSPAVEYESISSNSVSFPFTITSGVNVNADEFLNISDYENYVKIGDFSNSDMGFIIVKKRDACWINKVDIYSDDVGTNRGGRSSTPRTSSSNN